MTELLTVSPDNFEEEVLRSPLPVVMDFGGPHCQPCKQLDPFVEELSEELQGQVKVVRVVAPEARRLCIDLKVMGLPTFLAFAGGEEVQRLSGDVKPADIREMALSLANLPSDNQSVDAHLVDDDRSN